MFRFSQSYPVKGEVSATFGAGATGNQNRQQKSERFKNGSAMFVSFPELLWTARTEWRTCSVYFHWWLHRFGKSDLPNPKAALQIWFSRLLGHQWNHWNIPTAKTVSSLTKGDKDRRRKPTRLRQLQPIAGTVNLTLATPAEQKRRFGCQKEKMKNWRTSVDAYTTEDYEKFAEEFNK